MKTTKEISIYVLCFAILMLATLYSKAQEYSTYSLNTLTDRHIVNPALIPDCKFYFGLPLLSSFNIGYENRGLKMLDILENTNNLNSVLDSDNSFAFDFRYTPVNFGISYNKSFFTFEISNKTETGFLLPRDLLYFLWNGNKDHIGKMMDFSGLKLEASNYFEYSFGYSYQVMEDLRVGAKLKFLRGFANLDTKHWDMGVYTHDGTYIWDLHSNVMLNASMPLDPEYDDQDPEKLTDLVSQDINAADLFFGNKNRGMAIDIGGVYNFNDKITLSASFLDLFSSIKWRNNVLNIYQDTTFTWSGVDFGPFMDADNEQEDDHLWDGLLDSIADAFVIKSSENNYKTKIGPKFFLAGNYAVNSWIDAGLMIHGKYYNEHLYMAYSLTGNAELSRLFNASMTYTMFGSGSANLGLGMVFNLGFFQLYLITDNILGIKYDPELNLPWPATSQNVDFKFGMNFKFGTTK